VRREYIPDPQQFFSTVSASVIPSRPSDNIRYAPSSSPIAYTVWLFPPKKQRKKRKKSP
jgi:hypothetical protein